MDKITVKTENWDEGAPLGNGRTGSLVYGRGIVKITADRTDLWDLRPNETTLEKGFTYANLVRLSKSGKEEEWAERERLFEDIFMGKPYPSKITAGRLELAFGKNAEDISCTLDLNTATAEIYCGEKRLTSVFVSGEANVGVIRTYAEYNLRLHVPAYLSGMPQNGSGLEDNLANMSLKYPPAVMKSDGKFTWYEQNTHTKYAFGIIVYESDGVIYYTLVTTDDDEDYIAYGKKMLLNAAQCGVERLFALHKKEWGKYWRKSRITTGDRLLDDTYKKSWYLFKCCSGKGGYPMPLQGVWTADNDCLPPWKGDYHYDTNTELSYQSYLKANRLEEGVVFVDYLWKLKPTYEKFAKEFFGVNGLLIPSCSTLDGKAMGGWAQYSLSPTMTIWAAQNFDEYYLYTGDENFLKERASPFFKETGSAIKSLLTEKNGKLYLPLSSSPEIFDDTRKAYLRENSNFDLALLIYLFRTLKVYAEKLGDDSSEYEAILEKFDDIAVSPDGVVMLDKTQKLPETHRHFSHLMCLYPLHLINYDTEENKRIYESTIKDLEILGTGYWVGFSFVQSAQIYAMAKNGNASYERLRQFCRGFVGDNGFHLNGDFRHFGYTQFHYRPFTLEALFGFCDALHEMLLQDHTGKIELFAAIPQEWKTRTIGFKNLRSRGGLIISAKLKNGIITELSVTAPKECRVSINGETYHLNKGINTLIRTEE